MAEPEQEQVQDAPATEIEPQVFSPAENQPDEAVRPQMDIQFGGDGGITITQQAPAEDQNIETVKLLKPVLDKCPWMQDLVKMMEDGHSQVMKVSDHELKWMDNAGGILIDTKNGKITRTTDFRDSKLDKEDAKGIRDDAREYRKDLKVQRKASSFARCEKEFNSANAGIPQLAQLYKDMAEVAMQYGAHAKEAVKTAESNPQKMDDILKGLRGIGGNSGGSRVSGGTSQTYASGGIAQIHSSRSGIDK